MPAQFEQGPLKGLIIVHPRVFPDERGYFLESYKASEYAEFGIEPPFVQDNQSHSLQGVVRGLHYQLPPHEQGKLVSVLAGRALDVAVDIRRGSPTFAQYFSIVLDALTPTLLYIPPGFAHGFAALSDEVHLLYKCTAEYHPRSERGIRWNDPRLAIEWQVSDPAVSKRDSELPLLFAAELFGEEFL